MLILKGMLGESYSPGMGYFKHLEVGSDGSLYFISNAQLSQYTLDQKTLTEKQTQTLAGSEGGTRALYALTLSPEGTLYTYFDSGSNNRRVLRFDRNDFETTENFTTVLGGGGSSFVEKMAATAAKLDGGTASVGRQSFADISLSFHDVLERTISDLKK